MNNREFKCATILSEMVDNYGLVGIKTSFEDEGASFNEVIRLKELCNQARTKLLLKIQGAEAKRDLADSIIIGVKGIVAPMIESPFALDKYIDSVKNILGEELMSSIQLGINIETFQAYKNFDEISKYAKEKGVEIIMHHETSAATETYEKQQDKAYALMQKYGMHAVKSGYVGKILPKGEFHHGQYMVNQYNNAAIKAAKYQVAVNAHEPIKATGLRRTYPNIISREGLRGQEFNAWSPDGGNPPEHLSIVAFTRMLAGPVDFTPGIFNIKFNEYKKDNQVNTTLAHQLALYVVVYSPVQMAADLVEHYEANPKPLQFIKDVGVDWSETKVLNGEVGEFVTIARKERKTENWFLGSITDEKSREINIDFSFLDDNAIYEAKVYKDGKSAHWDKNPLDIEFDTFTVKNESKVKFNLAEGGGLAISLIKK